MNINNNRKGMTLSSQSGKSSEEQVIALGFEGHLGG